MEKVVYLLRRPDGRPPEEFRDAVRGAVAERLLSAGVRGLQLNVADRGPSPVAPEAPVDAVVSVWLDTAIEQWRRTCDAVVGGEAGTVTAYLVAESVPLPNRLHPAAPGEATAGFAQVAFLRRPHAMAYERWLDEWHNHHTQVAIHRQSTFGYVQNVVVRALGEESFGADRLGYDAVVEELFPQEALTDMHVFFDAVGDHDRMKRNATAMYDSVVRFGADTAEVIRTTQYILRTPWSPS